MEAADRQGLQWDPAQRQLAQWAAMPKTSATRPDGARARLAAATRGTGSWTRPAPLAGAAQQQQFEARPSESSRAGRKDEAGLGWLSRSGGLIFKVSGYWPTQARTATVAGSLHRGRRRCRVMAVSAAVVVAPIRRIDASCKNSNQAIRVVDGSASLQRCQPQGGAPLQQGGWPAGRVGSRVVSPGVTAFTQNKRREGPRRRGWAQAPRPCWRCQRPWQGAAQARGDAERGPPQGRAPARGAPLLRGSGGARKVVLVTRDTCLRGRISSVRPELHAGVAADERRVRTPRSAAGAGRPRFAASSRTSPPSRVSHARARFQSGLRSGAWYEAPLERGVTRSGEPLRGSQAVPFGSRRSARVFRRRAVRRRVSLPAVADLSGRCRVPHRGWARGVMGK